MTRKRTINLSWNRWLGPAILVSLGCVFVAAPLARGQIYFCWDNAHQHYAQTDFLRRSLDSGEFPHWWPEVGLGIPTVAEGQSSHFHPLRLLLALMLSTPIAFMAEIGVCVIITGISMYFFLREHRLHRAACVLAGICQMFGSYSIVSLNNMAIFRSYCLLPLAMLLAERYVRRSSMRSALCASLVTALQFLAGHPTLAIVTAIASTTYVFCRVWQRTFHKDTTFRTALSDLSRFSVVWIASLGLGIGLAAVQIIPSMAHIGQSIRAGGLDFEYAVVTSLPARIRYFPQLIYPYIYWQNHWLDSPTSWGSYFNEVPYLGIYVGAAAPLLVFYSLWWRRRYPDPGLALIISCVVATGFALGAQTPLYPALWNFPGMDGMRMPCRFLAWTSFCLISLAAIGMHRLLLIARMTTRSRTAGLLPGAIWLIIMIVTGVCLWMMRDWYATGVNVSPTFGRGLLASLALTTVATLWCMVYPVVRPIFRPIMVAGLITFTVGDLFALVHHADYLPTIARETLFDPPETVRNLDAGGESFRVLTLISPDDVRNRTEDLYEFAQADTCTLWGIDSADVFCSLVPRRYHAVHEGLLWELQHSNHAIERLTEFLGALNVKYVIAPREVDLHPWKRVRQTKNAVVWDNPGFLPRAFLVGEVVSESNEQRDEWFQRATYSRLQRYHEMVADWYSRIEESQILDNIMANPVNYRTTAVVAGEDFPTLQGLDAATKLQLISQSANTLHYRISSTTESFLVVSSNYYPGWQATVNGQTVELRRANFLGMGVFVPPGDSDVIFRFRTPLFAEGVAVSLVAIAVLFVGFRYCHSLSATLLMREMRVNTPHQTSRIDPITVSHEPPVAELLHER